MQLYHIYVALEHVRGIVALGRVYACPCAAGRAAGIAKAPRRTSINTGLSLVVWVLSGQGVSPGKQLTNRQSATWLSAAIARIRFVLLFFSLRLLGLARDSLPFAFISCYLSHFLWKIVYLDKHINRSDSASCKSSANYMGSLYSFCSLIYV